MSYSPRGHKELNTTEHVPHSLALPGTGASVEEDERLCELAADLQLPDLQLKEALEAVVGARGPVCLLAGGEPTVQLQGSGKGGRNQELALRVGVELRQWPLGTVDVLFLSGGTDGQDGPTEAAGAWVTWCFSREYPPGTLGPGQSSGGQVPSCC